MDSEEYMENVREAGVMEIRGSAWMESPVLRYLGALGIWAFPIITVFKGICTALTS